MEEELSLSFLGNKKEVGVVKKKKRQALRGLERKGIKISYIFNVVINRRIGFYRFGDL